MNENDGQLQGQADHRAAYAGGVPSGPSGVADLGRFVGCEEMREMRAEIAEILHRMVDVCLALASGEHNRNES